MTSRAAMFLFYRRDASIGTTGPFETVAAVKAGEAVHKMAGASNLARRVVMNAVVGEGSTSPIMVILNWKPKP